MGIFFFVAYNIRVYLMLSSSIFPFNKFLIFILFFLSFHLQKSTNFINHLLSFTLVVVLDANTIYTHFISSTLFNIDTQSFNYFIPTNFINQSLVVDTHTHLQISSFFFLQRMTIITIFIFLNNDIMMIVIRILSYTNTIHHIFHLQCPQYGVFVLLHYNVIQYT